MNEKTQNPLTFRALLIGIAGLIVITASSLYVALRMGALPWPTIFVTVLSMAALKKAKGSTIQEINVTHTIMSAGAMVAGGLAFTLPGLWILSPDAVIPFIEVLILTITGAILGTLFTTLFRTNFIEKENLPYPMGMAAYNTLVAGMEKGKGAKTLFTSMGGSVVFTFLRDKLGWIPAVITPFKGNAVFPALPIWISPMALGIGAIIGPTLAIVWVAGAIIGHYIITPLGITSGFFTDMAAADVFRSNLGIGLMIGTGLGVLVKAIIGLVKKAKNSKEDKKSMPRNVKYAIVVIVAFATILLTLTTEITFLEALLLIAGVYLTTYLSGMLTGQTGVNPMEIFAILVLLAISVILHPSTIAAFSITAVVAVACGLTGDVMNDLKSGHMLGTNPRSQLIGEGIGGVIGAVVATIALFALKKSFGTFGTPELPAPQASAVAAMVGGLGNNTAFIIGVVIGLLLYLFNIPAATLGLGFYLGVSISAIMAIGAIMAMITKAVMKDSAKADTQIALISSGCLGGEGITGVIIAIWAMLT